MATRQSSDPQAPGEVTVLLKRWTDGDSRAVDGLLPLVYDELRGLAALYLGRERAGHTLPPTGLVHEAYLRLVGSDVGEATIDDRAHFFAVAAQAMRRILVEHARRHAAARRPSSGHRLALEADSTWDRTPTAPEAEILALHQALERLKEDHPRQARVVELKYFGGLSEEESGRVLGVSRATVARDWRIARLLLGRDLRPGPERPGPERPDPEGRAP